MTDILGVGLTHYPSIIAPDEDRVFPLTRTLRANDRIPLTLKHPSSWPEPMRLEYGLSIEGEKTTSHLSGRVGRRPGRGPDARRL